MLDENYQKSQKTSASSSTVFYYSIQFHFVRKSDGTPSANEKTELDLLDLIKYLNQYLIGSYIQFEHCNSINYINSNELFNMKMYDETEADKHHVNGVINMFFVNSITDDNNDDVDAYAHFPKTGDRIFIIYNQMNSINVVHELGHFFDLAHTHESIDGCEFADGSNCAGTGDLICDTPADPGIFKFIYDPDSCKYKDDVELSSSAYSSDCAKWENGYLVDPNGDRYQPDISNIMSYALEDCQNNFTTQQYERMFYCSRGSRSDLSYVEVAYSLEINDPLSSSENFISYDIEANCSIDKGADVTMKATNSIILKAGFKAQSGCYFKASIVPTSYLCSSIDIQSNKKENDEIAFFKIDSLSIESTGDLVVYPNPVTNHHLTINYFVTQPAFVELTLYNAQGQNLLMLYSNLAHPKGNFILELNLNKNIYPGIYYCKYQMNEKIYSEKIILSE
jgi:hypothetical protein